MTDLGARKDIYIERLVYGGDGLGRSDDGRAIFVPGALVGETVRVEIVEIRSAFAKARLIEVLKSSPHRRIPPCQYYGDCGGCQLQHAAYEAQVAAKAEFIREALNRIGRIAWTEPIAVLSGPEWAYRGRAQFKIASSQTPNHWTFGFYKSGTNALCEIDACRILAPPLNEGLLALRRVSSSQASKTIDLTVGRDANGDPSLSAFPPGFGLPQAPVAQRVGGFTYAYDAACFFQVNIALIETLIHEAVTKSDETGRVAIDLYAGVGLFTLPLAKRFDTVYSVEESRKSSVYAVKNCQANALRNVQCINQSVEQWLKTLTPFTKNASCLLVDPPRAGLTKATRHGIIRLFPQKITYVSCDPTTLARDVRFFIDRGYQLESVVGIDLFPQTYHIETIARLVSAETA